MILAKRIGPVLVSAVIAFLCTGTVGALELRPNAVPTTRQVPNAFGTEDYTVTTVTALAFYPERSGVTYNISGSLGRFGPINTLTNYYASLDLPAGAVIDYIGLNSNTDTAFVIGAEVVRRDDAGNLSVIGGIDSTVHGWDTDYNASAIGYLWNGAQGEALILHVQVASNPNLQFFGWVEVWWRRTVSPAPAFATFGDVPVGHSQHRFVEALAAAGITAGCAGGNYCPDEPVTRGQMAVFLSVALGLHWVP